MVSAFAAPAGAGGLGRRFLSRGSFEKGLVLSALVHLSLVLVYRATADRVAPPRADQEYGRPIEVRRIDVAVIIARKLPFLVRPNETNIPPAGKGVFVPVAREQPVSSFPEGVSGPISDDLTRVPGGPPNHEVKTDLPPGETPAPFGTVEVQPVPVEAPRPAYPEWAREAGIQGTVVLHVLVGVDGRVERVVVVRGVLGLDDEASRTVRRWRFRPAASNGIPLAVWVEIPVAFRL